MNQATRLSVYTQSEHNMDVQSAALRFVQVFNMLYINNAHSVYRLFTYVFDP